MFGWCKLLVVYLSVGIRYWDRIMVKKFFFYFSYLECICWGCDCYCLVEFMGCGNGVSCI